MYNIHVCEAASLNLLNQFTFKMRQIFVISFEIEKKKKIEIEKEKRTFIMKQIKNKHEFTLL